MSTQQVYNCEILEVFSGDDLMAMVDLGVEDLFQRRRLRLFGVDTPPAISVPPNQEAGQIRAQVRALTRFRKSVITVKSRVKNSWVVELVTDTDNGPINVNELLVARGYQFKR